MIYGYIVPTDMNSKKNLERELYVYAARCHLNIEKFIYGEGVGKNSWRDSELARFFYTQARAGDEVIIYEAPSLARSALQVLEFFMECVEKGIHIHFVKYQAVFKAKERIEMARFLRLMQNIESDFVAKRTTEALARRRAQGLPLGRPKGRKNKTLKLDKHRKEIQKYLNLHVSKASIAKLIGCHAQTLYNYIDMRGLKAERTPQRSGLHRAIVSPAMLSTA